MNIQQNYLIIFGYSGVTDIQNCKTGLSFEIFQYEAYFADDIFKLNVLYL
jgi:hypothetical protein